MTKEDFILFARGPRLTVNFKGKFIAKKLKTHLKLIPKRNNLFKGKEECSKGKTKTIMN